MVRYHEFGIYEDVLDVLRQMPNAQNGLKRDEAKRRLQITPGLFFSAGTTWDEILMRMVSWGWLSERGGKLYICR